jgi:hypothetical protein
MTFVPRAAAALLASRFKMHATLHDAQPRLGATTKRNPAMRVDIRPLQESRNEQGCKAPDLAEGRRRAQPA